MITSVKYVSKNLSYHKKVYKPVDNVDKTFKIELDFCIFPVQLLFTTPFYFDNQKVN